MMQRVFRRTVAFLAALFILAGGVLPALALGNADTRTVRVGFYHAEGYSMMDENGNRSGYAYDVLQAMKVYADWRYEYIGYDKGWADIQQMLLDGEIDMAVSAVKTPARMEIYDFSDRLIGQSGASLIVRAGESKYVAGQYGSYNGMRIGFIENASHIASTEAFAQEKGFTYLPVYYKTSDELEAAILSGTDIDAAVTSNMRIVQGTRRLELFAMQDIHIMVQKGNKELLAEVNYALEQISLYHPGLYESLFNKYYSVDMGSEVFFTPEEVAFIEECRSNGDVIRASLTPDLSPYAYYEGSEPAGILYDIASEALRRTGLAWELTPAKTDAEYQALIEDRGVDLRLAARQDYNYSERLGYTLIDPYYTTDVSRVMRKEYDDEIKTVGVVKNSVVDVYYLPTILNGETVVRFDSVDECVDALLAGRCDALYLLTRTAQEAVFSDETNRLSSVIMPGFNFSFTIGVREDADSRLSSILEKAVDSLSEEDIAAIVLKYTDYTFQPVTLKGILYNNPIVALTIVAVLFALLFSAIMIPFFIKQRKLEQEKNQQLQNALDAAEQANSAKSVFMSRMSHEIRTPLNAIVGYNAIAVGTLAAARHETEYRRAAMTAMDCLTKSDIASKHLLTVINDVLDMSAIESGRLKIACEPFDFKSMISALTIMFYSQARSKGVTFDVVFRAPVEEWFMGDQMRISQIVTNLLSNAVKFTPEGGGVQLTIAQENKDDETSLLRLEIVDSGIGMSEDFLKTIWTPFEQADASISRRFGGTGLGLSITKNLVDIIGGTIAVKSALGKGSTFTLELPLKRMQQPNEDDVYDFSSINVLVVDNEKSACDYLTLIFSRSGVKCASVTTGEEAIIAISRGIELSRPFTVCIIDWHMPDTDVLYTVRRIRELAGPEMPIIVISAYDFSDIVETAKEAGVNLFVKKPLFQSAIFDLLANISGKRSPITSQKQSSYNFRGKRVLLAEDNKMNMEIAKALLTAYNLQVDEAWNGQEAVDRFRSSPAGTYAAILMDVHMPEVDGYRATQIIRALDRPDAADLPIIAMTADVFAEDVAEALASGMNAHVGKPIDRKLLLDALKRFIKD